MLDNVSNTNAASSEPELSNYCINLQQQCIRAAGNTETKDRLKSVSFWINDPHAASNWLQFSSVEKTHN